MFAVAVAHGTAGVAVLAASLPVGVKILMLVALGVSSRRLWQLAVPEMLVLYGDGRFLKVGAGDTALELVPGSTMLASLLVLRYREEGRLRSLVLLADSFVCADDARRFRRWLAWQADNRL